MQNQQTIEAFAAALWKALPYDFNLGATTCPTEADALAAVKLALARTGIVLEQQPVKAVSRA